MNTAVERSFTPEKELTPAEIYKIHRDYIQHEDSLINHRTTWLITVQSFLIATFGFSYQKKFEVAEKLQARGLSLDAMGPTYDEYRTFMITLAIVGVITALAALCSVFAAVSSIRAVQDTWQKKFGTLPHPYLPGLIGGGSDKIASLGVLLSMWAPIFFSLLWLTTIVFLLFKFQAGVR
ncbi:hypothetical protein [Aquabacterium sp.]|uniref:hypothetical protein n=1 Tax=Aquabacterium sp. TaxID=1872578 RepID=UPI003D6CBCEB